MNPYHERRRRYYHRPRRRSSQRSAGWLREDQQLETMPDHALLNVINIPRDDSASPRALITRRVVYALILLVFVAILVYADQDGYSEKLTAIDALYYSAVTLSTTGYGDIVPVTQSARLINTLVITPIRMAFLILLVGTTLAVLTEETRRTLQIQRWRRSMRDHTVVIGYGTKGSSAVSAMLADGADPRHIVVVDTSEQALEAANNHGLVTVKGSATKTDVLKLAGVPLARQRSRKRKRTPAGTIRRRPGSHQFRNRRPDARLGNRDPLCCRDDGGFAEPRRWAEHRRTPSQRYGSRN